MVAISFSNVSIQIPIYDIGSASLRKIILGKPSADVSKGGLACHSQRAHKCRFRSPRR